MSITKAHNLICPIDGVRLEQKDKQMVCDNGHSFDIARQGYINLLPVQHKRSKQPGDSKAMVLARTQFLDTGSYEPIARRLTDTVIEQVGTEGDICILDAGCGEGYYLDAVFNAVSDKAITDSVLDGDRDNNAISFIGIDISKDAVIQSSKRNKQISWIVATNRKPPVADESVDIILCLFGFLSLEAFHKILKPGGKIILVDPGSEHLKELREIIYPDVKKPEEGEGQPCEIHGFHLIRSEALKFEISLCGNEIINQLLIMTPHFYRASKQGREAAAKLQDLDLTVDVVFRIMKKI